VTGGSNADLPAELAGAALGGRADSQPRALIVTVYGLYAREVGGWLSVSSLIRLMARVGVDEPAVRSSISRLKRRGILDALRTDGKAGYALSEQARTILDEGDRRIFERRRGTLEQGWVLVVFSVPESERQRRHTLRSRLSWLGFGTVAPGVWIAPSHLEHETRAVLERHDLLEYVDFFRADYLGFQAVETEVGHWWDLAGLDALYQEFCDTHTATLNRWRARRGTDDEGEAFADYLRVLTTWRRLPYLDPGLPPQLLPPRWSGTKAGDLCFALRGRLERSAHRYVDDVRTASG
jgi:phenylacetic acid degradation operon negative regulatory protein